MKRIFAAAGAALAIASTGASAAAWIQGMYGDMQYKFDFSGVSYGSQSFALPVFDLGDTGSQSFAYDLTLHNDGEALAQPRTWSVCAPVGDFESTTTYCGPASTGFEQVEFDFGFVQTLSPNPNFQFTVTGAPSSSPINVGAGQTVHLKGRFTITETRIGSPGAVFPGRDDVLWIYSSGWVDSNSAAPSFVPEPSETSQWLFGLALLAVGATARRRLRD
jgi:hypothetical protein